MRNAWQFLGRVVACLTLGVVGCSEELGPESSFPTSTVRGVVRYGDRPIPGGYLEIHPVDGTRGNLRIARIAADGTFHADQVPVGRVAIALSQLPMASIPSPNGPVSSRIFEITRRPIRRTIPALPSSDLPIDLMVEVERLADRRGVRPRRRNRLPTKSKRQTSAEPVAEASSGPVIRVIYREGSGVIHLDWPSNRLAQALGDAQGMVWVDVMDLESSSNLSVEAMFREVFRFHPLAIEDAIKDTHVPKIDDWGSYLYLVVDTIDFDPETDDLRLHELDLFLGPNFLVTYHNEPTEVLDRHRRNIEREPENRLHNGAGYLLYRILDDVVDEFLPAIVHLEDAIDDAQDEVFHTPTPKTLQRIFHVKRCALQLHRVVVPIREVLNRLARDPYAQVKVDDRIYFRDVYDHLVRVHDIIESLRDLISGALDTYLSVVSNRTNDIMKALTLVNVMFLPMSFMAGFFGMNFFGETLMFTSPPLPRAWMFAITLTAMIGTPVLMWGIARRRGWF